MPTAGALSQSICLGARWSQAYSCHHNSKAYCVITTAAWHSIRNSTEKHVITVIIIAKRLTVVDAKGTALPTLAPLAGRLLGDADAMDLQVYLYPMDGWKSMQGSGRRVSISVEQVPTCLLVLVMWQGKHMQTLSVKEPSCAEPHSLD